jgi:hypothetical protein
MGRGLLPLLRSEKARRITFGLNQATRCRGELSLKKGCVRRDYLVSHSLVQLYSKLPHDFTAILEESRYSSHSLIPLTVPMNPYNPPSPYCTNHKFRGQFLRVAK